MSQAPDLRVDITVSPGAPEVQMPHLSNLLRFAAQHEGATAGATMSLWICSDDEISDLHERFMGIPGPTDVISFPSGGAGGGEAYLGDVAVSFETAAVQADDAGHSTEREVGYLALHGLLHLLGYDDVGPEDRSRMIARQDQLLHDFEREQRIDWA